MEQKRKFPCAKYSALEISRFLINLYDEKGFRINNLKLNALLYCMQGDALKVLGYPLFREELVRWSTPVVPCVFKEYKIFGLLDIPKIEKYEVLVKTKYRPVTKTYHPPHFSAKEKRFVLRYLIEGSINYEQLNKTEPFAKTRKGDVISLNDMWEYFRKR